MKYPASSLDKPGANLAAPETVSLSDIRPCISLLALASLEQDVVVNSEGVVRG